MSITSFSTINDDRIFNTSFHRRKESEELDVFEATHYFLGSTDDLEPEHGPIVPYAFEHRLSEKQSGSNMDRPMMIKNPINLENAPLDRQKVKENKKPPRKQPSSPARKLTCFINSIFNQTIISRKKKSKTIKRSGIEALGDKNREGRITGAKKANSEDHPVSCFYAKTPTKSCHKDSSPKFIHFQSRPGNGEDFGPLDRRNSTATISVGHDEDDEESDSSSDLFDLPSHELDYGSKGLPVYGTTHMDRIRVGASISRVHFLV